MKPPLLGLLHSALAVSSPWASAEWRITFNFGRDNVLDDSSAIDKSWGASGSRLALSIEVLVESASYFDSAKERDFMGGSGASNCLSVLDDATYVTLEKGQQSVRFGPTGAWKILTRRTGRPGDSSVIRFWLYVCDNAVRNDVTLNAGERLYATANCWREVDFDIGRRRLAPYQTRLKAAQDAIDARLEHSTGDRRLDGTDIVDTALASIDMAMLVKQRDDLLSELRSVQQKLPQTSEISKPGHWPGSTENLVIANGKVGVKRRKGLWEEFHILGTWSATPLEVTADMYYEETEDVVGETG
jgi:hypothetical protein